VDSNAVVGYELENEWMIKREKRKGMKHDFLSVEWGPQMESKG
jgi:hypothetical protein